MIEPKPCPFCGVHLSYLNRWMEYHHPNDDCIIGGSVLPEDEELIEKWNRRVNE